MRGALELLGQQILVVTALDPAGDAFVAPQTTNVLRRARPATCHKFDVLRRLRKDSFDLDDMLPAVTEIVVVPELVALGGQNLIQTHVIFQNRFLPFG